MKLEVECQGSRFKILGADGNKLNGSCARCGACCETIECQHLSFEYVGEVHGKYRRQAVCGIYQKRPMRCFLWPLPDDDLPQSCGFHWEK